MDFSRKYRITKTKEFAEVYNLGKWFNSPLIDVSVKSNTLGITRLGLSVSKSVGSAHKRNLIKRRLRSLFISTHNIHTPKIHIFIHIFKFGGSCCFAFLVVLKVRL